MAGRWRLGVAVIVCVVVVVVVVVVVLGVVFVVVDVLGEVVVAGTSTMSASRSSRSRVFLRTPA